MSYTQYVQTKPPDRPLGGDTQSELAYQDELNRWLTEFARNVILSLPSPTTGSTVANVPFVTTLVGSQSGNYTPLTNMLRITAIGAGGGSTAGAAGAGGAGESVFIKLLPVTAGTPVAYVVGAGAAGLAGTDTSIGFIVCHGGGVGTAVFGVGGGWANSGGLAGANTMFEDADTSSGANGGNAINKGGGAGLFGPGAANGSGASSVWGLGGASNSDAPTTSYGAGSGANAGVAKKGADGILIIEEVGN